MRDEPLQDDILFDRLVDGELSEAERRRLLASLDAQPDGWRRCALAFLEAQTWKRDFATVTREPANQAPVAEHSRGVLTESKPQRRGTGWLAIAAGLLIAFTLGRANRTGELSVVTLPTESEAQLATVTSPQQEKPKTKPLDDAITFWVRDDAGKTQSVRVPLVDAGTLDRHMGTSFQSAIPPEIRDRMQQRGYDLQSKRRYAPLWLENGSPMIVPVEDTKIVPVSQNIY